MIPNFPHFPRFFAARFWREAIRLSVLAIIVTSFLFLRSDSSSLSHFEKLKFTVIKGYQKNPQAHLELARKYQRVNDFENARHEILLGLAFEPENKDLKAALMEMEKLINQPQEVAVEIERWEKVNQDSPGYRDAYLKLAQLYFSLYQNEKAQENLDKALELDPNFEPTRNMEKILRN